VRRLKRVKSWLEDERLDCVVVAGEDPVTHLCGYSRYYGGPSALAIGRDGMRILVVMRDEAAIARELSAADEVVGYGERGFGIDLDPLAKLVAAVEALPIVAAAGRIGLHSELPTFGERLAGVVSATTVPAGEFLQRLRLVKDEDELRAILASYDLCWLAQRSVGDSARPGVEEIALFTGAQSVAQLAHGGPIEFLCDLLSGPNTAEVCCPIHVAGRRRAEPGDPVIADIVVRGGGYWGDTAETHVVGENDEIAAVRARLLELLAESGRSLVPGATGGELFRRMSDAILADFPGSEFPHHGGHGIGLGNFEDPHIRPGDDLPFEEGMVIAVEPGAYFPRRFGVRVENVFLVTVDGGVELRHALGASVGPS
jgi:Xaa-Pro aminopeptidase